MAYFNTSNPLIYNQKDARIGKGNIAPATIDMSKAGYQLIRQFEAFESDAITLADQEYLVVQMKYETKSSIDALLFVNPEIAFFTSGVFIAPGADLLRITPPTLQPNIAPKSNVTTWGVDIGQTGGGVIAHATLFNNQGAPASITFAASARYISGQGAVVSQVITHQIV